MLPSLPSVRNCFVKMLVAMDMYCIFILNMVNEYTRDHSVCNCTTERRALVNKC